jgi:cytochrome c-type biogenesis protein CcmH/NrfF
MTEELNEVEARQGDRRQMNMRVLFWGLPAALLLIGFIVLLWA